MEAIFENNSFITESFVRHSEYLIKVIKFINLQNTNKVLEIGSGYGGFIEILINSISNIDKSLVKDVRVFDVYQGDNIPENQKSIAISVTIQSSEKTLNETDLEQINNLIIKTVENKTGAKIRS